MTPRLLLMTSFVVILITDFIAALGASNGAWRNRREWGKRRENNNKRDTITDNLSRKVNPTVRNKRDKRTASFSEWRIF